MKSHPSKSNFVIWQMSQEQKLSWKQSVQMDPNAWQAYHQAAAAYSNRFNSSSNQDDPAPAYHNPLSLLAASQHYQHNSLLPPSLLAAQQHKTSSAQQALASHLLTPPVTPVSTAWEQQRRSVIEAKASQPAFPGQPPPLQDVRQSGQRNFLDFSRT